MADNKRVALLGIAALSVSAVVFADDARALLERMERSLAGRNYQGTFVHEHGGQTETLRIIHRAEPGGFAERVVSLDGSGREVIRRDGEVRAYFPDQRAVLVDGGQQRGGLLFPGLAGLDSAAGQVYAVREEARARCSGRNAHVVVVEPRDEFRYGYRVWIDDSSAMPLKTQLRNSNGRVMEQVVFTELTLPVHIPDAALQPAVVARDYRWLRRGAVSGVSAERPADATWDASELPPGFRLISNSTQFVGGGQRPATHLVFSDGLASVSVFVEAPSAVARDPDYSTTTMTSLGSSSALSTEVDGHKVTAIGEVPPDTVRAITRSLRVGFVPGGSASSGPKH
jgi:sigma-E factor negative regulatory protein RseB